MRQTVCLNMIVKNESHVIRRCLASARPWIDRWLIVDTGSEDGTREIAKECLRGIPGELHRREWVHFEQNRNEALELAGKASDYLLFLDADELLVVDGKWGDFREPCYQVPVVLPNGLSAMRPLLVGTKHAWRWQGVIHEEIVRLDGPFAPATLQGVHIEAVQDGRRSKDPERHLKDARMLKEALDKEPHHARYASFLALSYEQAGLFELAIEAHERRAAMGGWEEEVFFSLFRVGAIRHQLKNPSKMVVDALTSAYRFRPSRVEPMYCLALHYFELKEPFLAFALLKQILSAPHPEDRTLIDASVYDYKRHLLLIECARALGWREELAAAIEEALRLATLPGMLRNRLLKEAAMSKLCEI